MVIALLYGTGLLQDYFHRRRLSARWKSTLRVGILNDSEWNLENTDTYAWTDVSPNNWKSQLEQTAQAQGSRLVVELIQISSQFDSYAIILNPYGEVYPEEDLANLTSLRKVINFVREGGLFVNVAGIPSYWAYNLDLRRRLDIAQTVYGAIQTGGSVQIFSTKPFELTPLAKELGLRIVGTDSPFGVDLAKILGRKTHCIIICRRFAIVESNTETCSPTISLLYPDGKPYDMSPIFFVKYGKGEFLISLPWIQDSTHSASQKEWLRDAICELTVQRSVQMKETT